MLKLSLVLLLCASNLVAAQHSEEWTRWNELSNEWGDAAGQHKGQVCDSDDMTEGCVVVFVAEPDADFNVKNLPLGQQDKFLNTQHYEGAWNFHGEGFLGSSLPRAPQDIHPVCYIANVSGTIVLGYEEGSGDVLLPCPGADSSIPFTESMILDPKADLEDMCNQCYQGVCSGRKTNKPYLCGGHGNGGVEVGESDQGSDKSVATLIAQTGPSYHCHLTMKNECDALEHDQHEVTEGYGGMNYGVLCGWDKVRFLNLSHCDCQMEAGKSWPRCSRNECLGMAYQGVVCGNCGGCNKDRTYESIFSPTNDADVYDGVCAKVRTSDNELGRNYSMMMCSKSLFCRDTDGWGDACVHHCETFGVGSETWVDPRCVEQAENSARRLMTVAEEGAKGQAMESVVSMDSRIDFSHVHPDYPAIIAWHFVRGPQ